MVLLHKDRLLQRSFRFKISHARKTNQLVAVLHTHGVATTQYHTHGVATTQYHTHGVAVFKIVDS